MIPIWDEIKGAFSGTENKPDETTKAILDIESKKKAISQASMNEQNAIKSKISDAYRKIGEASYALHKESNYDIEKITGMFETVTGYFQTLEENTAKLNGILNRYDEELKILRPSPPEGQTACSNCGTAYIVSETIFCSGCGNKVSEVHADVAGAESTPQPVCSSCTAKIIPGAVFCAGCGHKVS
ncbi:MAG: zinc ribbon domain-containing protein [Defluviitaleaceae bacterium]|nr:zinc ribbon domain-containing protein [Defluviitaleaceae bacterium]MCL2273649.1 zinc ribbon domain-containing protein [Defluviitaleaceae bacterium]